MRIVYKYQLNYGVTTVTLPAGAKPVHAGLQDGVPFVWCEVGVQMPNINYKFILIGTGQLLPDPCQALQPLQYVSTFIDGDFVWHVYYQQA